MKTTAILAFLILVLGSATGRGGEDHTVEVGPQPQDPANPRPAPQAPTCKDLDHSLIQGVDYQLSYGMIRPPTPGDNFANFRNLVPASMYQGKQTFRGERYVLLCERPGMETVCQQTLTEMLLAQIGNLNEVGLSLLPACYGKGRALQVPTDLRGGTSAGEAIRKALSAMFAERSGNPEIRAQAPEEGDLNRFNEHLGDHQVNHESCAEAMLKWTVEGMEEQLQTKGKLDADEMVYRFGKMGHPCSVIFIRNYERVIRDWYAQTKRYAKEKGIELHPSEERLKTPIDLHELKEKGGEFQHGIYDMFELMERTHEGVYSGRPGPTTIIQSPPRR